MKALTVLWPLALLACEAGNRTDVAAAEVATPRQVKATRIEQSGYPTILWAPPAQFAQELPPPDPAQPTGNSDAPWYAKSQGVSLQEAERRMRLQRQVSGELRVLRQRLTREELGNYGGIFLSHGTEFGYVVGFKRDPQITLARYTRHPLFSARQVAYSDVELQAARQLWTRRFGEAGLQFGSGTDDKANRVQIDMAIEEARFRRIAAANGWLIPGELELRFPEPLTDVPVTLDAARFVRIFPQARDRTGFEFGNAVIGTIVMKNGCLYVEQPGDDDPVAFFGNEMQLFVDTENYLSLRQRGAPREAGHARVGERMVWSGLTDAITDPAVVEPVRAACGTRRVVNVGRPGSNARFRFNTGQIDGYSAGNGITREEGLRRFRDQWRVADEQHRRNQLALSKWKQPQDSPPPLPPRS